MAIIHHATLTPTKLELLEGWVRSQPWWTWDDASIELVGAYRFDDPAGAVGIETHLLRAGDGVVVQVPLTYRGAPLGGAEAALVGTMQHSALGERWVYDGCLDPVYVVALATAILVGGTEAELQVISDNGYQLREPTVRVVGSGTPGTPMLAVAGFTATSDTTSTTIRTGEWELVIPRAVDVDAAADGAQTLSGSWPGTDGPVVLARLIG